MMSPIPHNPKKIEMILLLCAIHKQPITITMFSAIASAVLSATGLAPKSSCILLERLGQYPRDTCVLCFKSGITRNASGCCDECDLFADLLVSDKDFAEGVELIVKQNRKAVATLKTQYFHLQAPIAGMTYSLFVPDTSIFSNPEKHHYYACLIQSFFRTRTSYQNDKKKQFLIEPTFGTFIANETGSIADMKQFCYCWMTCVQASLQVPVSDKIIPDFWLLEDRVEGVFHHICDMFPDRQRKMTVKSHIFRDDDHQIRGMFRLEDDRNIDGDEIAIAFAQGAPIYKQSGDCSSGKGGRCYAVRQKSFAKDLLFIDQVWEEKFGQKLAKKEQQRKEQERKEKKQRQREEQRELDRKRNEEEKALKLARASLVEAVAKVDVELETIRKLRELNREVALKNQKLADRKEAEKLAKEAEKRHAEKLKQKELERQKFLSKKQ
jgi:hypothetical protein